MGIRINLTEVNAKVVLKGSGKTKSSVVFCRMTNGQLENRTTGGSVTFVNPTTKYTSRKTRNTRKNTKGERGKRTISPLLLLPPHLSTKEPLMKKHFRVTFRGLFFRYFLRLS